MVAATWKSGTRGLHRADAQLVYEEIIAIGDSATPEQIVEAAKNPERELHKCFCWDDEEAARKYRIFQARQVVCHLVVKREQEQESETATHPTEIRLLHKTDSGSGYKPITLITQNKSEYEKLLQNALEDLRRFKAKYASLAELEEIIRLID